MPTFTNTHELHRHIMHSESALTVFGTKHGHLMVMYSDLLECHRLIKCGRAPVLHQVNKHSDHGAIREALALWNTGGPDPHARKRSLKAKSGG